MSRILAIHAHPDDVEILAGGAMALLCRAGHMVTIATMTAGDCGSAERSAEEISEIRRKEAKAAAGLIGADYRWCGFFDLAIFNDDVSRRRVTEVLRVTRPDIVVTASPVDYMADHENTSALVKDACFAAAAALYATGSPQPANALISIPHLYYMDPFTGRYPDETDAIRDFCVDVGEVFATKQAMLAHHASQREWLRRHHGMDDYMLQMETSTRSSGETSGFQFGECFRQYRGHPYPQTPLLQDLLGAGVKMIPKKGST
jgi:LmbE family N-acetylglucosaminyl deacetylase